MSPLELLAKRAKGGNKGSPGERGNFRCGADHQRVDIGRHPVLRDALLGRALHRQRLKIGICTCTFTVCYCNLYNFKYQG